MLEDLTGTTFSALRPATFKKTTKRLSGYATLKYGHYTGQAVQTRQPRVFSDPDNPSDKDIANATDGDNYWLQEELKDMMSKNRTYTYNLYNIFPTVLRCCDKDL